ncbi:hypothetical protein JVT61DRAFT_10799 [Boletus reticuloceps]|uniref:F-box domain-containing protein n=1 Tax=Boletus reticuloceps TaxID=495285 RepID=A0A8I3A4M4_9AGAM|nr:hypothetical protein JVT61DRAFT_10799 [Boletus reticuloceps]
MSDSTALSLPPEVLHVIFHYLDIPDNLRIRRPQQAGMDQCLSHSRVRSPSRSIPLAIRMRPGKGTRLWFSRPLEPPQTWSCSNGNTRKLREIRFKDPYVGVYLVFGRFLLVGFQEEVRCHDVNLEASDSTPDASIIYQSPGGMLRAFDFFSARSPICMCNVVRGHGDVTTLFYLLVAGGGAIQSDSGSPLPVRRTPHV